MKRNILIILIPLSGFVLLNFLLYSYSSQESKVLLPFRFGDKWGYINERYETIIAPDYDEANVFYDGEALVQKNRKYSFIDREGNTILDLPAAQEVNYFYEGLAAVKEGGKWGYVDTAGKIKIPFQFDDTPGFSEGLAPVKIGKLWGAIDKRGKIKIAPIYGELDGFEKGISPAVLHDKSGFINHQGKAVIPFIFSSTGFFSDGLTWAYSGDKCGIINTRGEWVIPPQFDNTGQFSEGVIPVEVGKVWYFVDRHGNKVNSETFESLGNLSSGLALAEKDKKFGYVNIKGEWVIPASFISAEAFSDGWAQVDTDNGDTYYIDEKGVPIWNRGHLRIPPKFWLYLLILLLPGLSAHRYCQQREHLVLNCDEEKAKEILYRTQLKMNWFRMVYIFWFFCGLSLLGSIEIFYTLWRKLWYFELGLGLPALTVSTFSYFSVYFLLMIPYLAGSLFITSASYRLDQLVRKTTWTQGQYLWMAVRGQLTMFLPLLIWVILSSFIPQSGPFYWLSLFLFVFLFFAFSPLVVRFVWRTKKIEDAAFLKKVHQVCDKAGIKVKGVIGLETGSSKIANAMVSGLFPGYRYIFFTDYLLTNFTTEETETILVHEIGHLKKRHQWLQLGLLLLWMLFSGFVYPFVEPFLNSAGIPMIVFYVIWLFIFYGIVFNFFSRIFENQADQYVVTQDGRIDVYISALNKVHTVNFMVRKWTFIDRFLKTHPDVETRIKNLSKQVK